MGQQGELRAWLQFLTGVPVQRPEEIKAKTFCLAQSIADIQKNQVPRPKDRAVLGISEYSKEASVAEVSLQREISSFAIH